MKTIKFLTNVALLILAVPAMSQNDETDFRENVKAGFKIGANYSNVYDSDGEEFRADGKLGLAMGAFIAIPFTKYLGIQPEILFSQKGFQASGAVLGSQYSMKRTSTFLDIPYFFRLSQVSF